MPPPPAPAPTASSEQRSPVARTIAIAALAAGVILLAVILLTGGTDHTYKVVFQNAGQLVKGDDVQIGGRRVGNIADIKLTNDNQAQVSIEVDSPYAPLHEGTTALIRATSLSGVANRYIQLAPGPNSRPKLPNGAILTTDKTTSPVDLDQLFNTLDPSTRRALQEVVQGSATQYAGKEKQANAAAKFVNPALSTTVALEEELLRDQQAFRNFISNSSRLVTALAARGGDLTNLITNSNTTAQAIGNENVALGQTLQLLPPTLRRANTTFVNLRATVDDLSVLTRASYPATKRLAPLLRQLRPLIESARPTIHDLRHLIHEPGPNNDLIDNTVKLPRLERMARSDFPRSIQSLKQSQPVVEFLRPYMPDFIGWLRDFGQSTDNYDANGHYARIQPIFNVFSANGSVLTPIGNNHRLEGLQSGILQRCPGAASQPPVDNSAPYRATSNFDCDPSEVLPGP